MPPHITPQILARARRVVAQFHTPMPVDPEYIAQLAEQSLEALRLVVEMGTGEMKTPRSGGVCVANVFASARSRPAKSEPGFADAAVGINDIKQHKNPATVPG